MTAEITDHGGYVELRYVTDSGSASVSVVGATKADVEDKKAELVDKFNLKERAQS